ncbi:U2 snRNP component prp10 [Tilletia horrida]|uniref:U2 snRNP component prp10 n=1 Tax=Tilletia horrida TaxID=155126 RepID=A0AAN6JJQ3_9BASI|nr:U2 snRNP component prp10 [Tilletia horrida]
MRPTDGSGGDVDGEEPTELDLTPKLSRKRRWDVADPAAGADPSKSPLGETQDKASSSAAVDGATQPPPRKRRSRWDETPAAAVNGDAPSAEGGAVAETPKRSSRWDQTPVASTSTNGFASETPVAGAVVAAAGFGGSRYMSDDDLDAILPAEGYKIVEPPPDYAPVRNPARKLLEKPVPLAGGGGFMMQDEAATRAQLEAVIPDLPTDIPGVGQLAYFKPEDQQYFDKILKPEDDLNSELTVEELKERKILCLLLTFELLDLLKALKRAIRRAAVNSFSHVAKAIGPQDVVQVLLNHLHMQERQCSVYAQQSPLPS